MFSHKTLLVILYCVFMYGTFEGACYVAEGNLLLGCWLAIVSIVGLLVLDAIWEEEA